MTIWGRCERRGVVMGQPRCLARVRTRCEHATWSYVVMCWRGRAVRPRRGRSYDVTNRRVWVRPGRCAGSNYMWVPQVGSCARMAQE
eukprot:7379086-Prymnesium_polylepis.1